MKASISSYTNCLASFFCVGYSNAWGKKAIHTRIGEIQKKYKSLSWIRTSMSYHRFPNMRELFSADLSRKLLENVKSLDFETLDCNCRRGICPYNKLCRTPMVVYKATCKTSKMSYIGNTQNHLKKRMQQHFGQVNDVLKNGKKSDTYADHFSEVWKHWGSPPSGLVQAQELDISIMWKGNALSTMKTFGTRNCVLCAKERVAIVKHWWKDKKTLINSNTEIFGGCRHKTKFHRYNDRNQASTDESNQDEIVEPDINLEGSDSVRIHSLLEECIVTESNQSRLV